MSSFQELEAIAAKRAADAQAKLAVERAERLRREKDDKAKADQDARLRAQREREAIVQREQRKRKEAESKAEEERRRKERAERAAKQQTIDARGKTLNATSSQMIIQARKFADAKKKAIERAGSSSSSSSRRDPYGATVVDWRQEDEIRASRGSTLTREEKRLKQQAVMLGLGESAGRPIKRKRAKGAPSVKAPPAKDLIPVGLAKRDKRSIDEIERDLLLARSGQTGPDKHGSLELTTAASRPLSKSAAPPTKRMHHGISPADFLPGAPLRAEMVPRKKETINATTVPGTVKKKAKEPPQQPPKRETARDRFLREEEEKKRLKTKLNGASQQFEEESEMSDEEEDEASSEDVAEDRDGGADYRDEIWKLFGRDRKQYVNRNDYSDDDDMEADMESVAREEARSARLARLEDEREERELQKLAAQKAAKKAARKVRDD